MQGLEKYYLDSCILKDWKQKISRSKFPRKLKKINQGNLI